MVSVDRLAAVNSRPKAVAVLTDVTDWRPDPRVQVIRPAKVPAGAPLFAAYADGLWLQAADDTMHAFGTDHENLTAAWGGASTVAQFTAALERAARRS